MGLPSAEAGVVRADRLASGVGYVEILGFPPLSAFKPVDRAMTTLTGRGALIFGDRRNGGANPTGAVPLGDGFMAAIPFGRSENPVTKTNWEGRGVQPDVAAPAVDA